MKKLMTDHSSFFFWMSVLGLVVCYIVNLRLIAMQNDHEKKSKGAKQPTIERAVDDMIESNQEAKKSIPASQDDLVQSQ